MNRSVMASGSETGDPTQSYINSFSPESSPEILIFRIEYLETCNSLSSFSEDVAKIVCIATSSKTQI